MCCDPMDTTQLCLAVAGHRCDTDDAYKEALRRKCMVRATLRLPKRSNLCLPVAKSRSDTLRWPPSLVMLPFLSRNLLVQVAHPRCA